MRTQPHPPTQIPFQDFSPHNWRYLFSVVRALNLRNLGSPLAGNAAELGTRDTSQEPYTAELCSQDWDPRIGGGGREAEANSCCSPPNPNPTPLPTGLYKVAISLPVGGTFSLGAPTSLTSTSIRRPARTFCGMTSVFLLSSLHPDLPPPTQLPRRHQSGLSRSHVAGQLPDEHRFLHMHMCAHACIHMDVIYSGKGTPMSGPEFAAGGEDGIQTLTEMSQGG